VTDGKRAGAASMRWADVLFTQGFGTRAQCAAILAAGDVRHEARTVADGDALVDTEGLHFEVGGQRWPYHERALVLLHKPAGFECSRRPGHHPSVLTLLPAPLQRRGVQPVGRLDADTTGALLLTDDGALLHRLTHPKHHVAKVYLATTRHPVDARTAQRLCEGVVLRDDPAPARAAVCEAIDNHTLRMTLTDGRYHQVKRMVAAVGNRCEALHREAFGRWTLPSGLEPRQWMWANEP
jgi:16S rRNA pseudouridine516 synthase